MKGKKAREKGKNEYSTVISTIYFCLPPLIFTQQQFLLHHNHNLVISLMALKKKKKNNNSYMFFFCIRNDFGVSSTTNMRKAPMTLVKWLANCYEGRVVL